jgi:hypothetical protein
MNKQLMMRWLGRLTAGMVLIGVAQQAPAAVFTETFDGASGWSGLSSEGTFSEAAGVLQLTYDPGGSPGGFIDAFQAEAGSANASLFGDYSAYTGFSFQFQGNTAPAETQIILGNSGTYIARDFTYSATGSFSTYTINLATSSGWTAPGDFSTVLADVDEILISVNSFGAGVQTYQLDNFSLLDTPFAAAIPEPGSGLFVVGATVLFLARLVRREMQMAAV